MAEIREAIEASDGYLVIVSPDLARSSVCGEGTRARDRFGKADRAGARARDRGRVGAIVTRGAQLDHRDRRRFLDHALDQTVEALRTDLDHVKAHTRPADPGRGMGASGRVKGLLLRGAEIASAERVVAADAEPRATPLQTRFVQASRAAASRRQRGLVGAVAAALVVSLALSAFALVQRGQAVENEQVATSEAAESRPRELAAASIGQLEVDPERSLLLAVEAMASARTPEAVSALRGSLAESHARATLRGSGASITDGPVQPRRWPHRDRGHRRNGADRDVNDPRAPTDLIGI